MTRPKTIFLDIDGVLLRHRITLTGILNTDPELLEGTVEKLHEWDMKGYRIILTTGRKESMRQFTINELLKMGIVYDLLIMGIGGGDRILINDAKPDGKITTKAICIPRNEGINKIDI